MPRSCGGERGARGLRPSCNGSASPEDRVFNLVPLGSRRAARATSPRPSPCQRSHGWRSVSPSAGSAGAFSPQGPSACWWSRVQVRESSSRAALLALVAALCHRAPRPSRASWVATIALPWTLIYLLVPTAYGASAGWRNGDSQSAVQDMRCHSGTGSTRNIKDDGRSRSW
jgi:hypothetical protein